MSRIASILTVAAVTFGSLALASPADARPHRPSSGLVVLNPWPTKPPTVTPPYTCPRPIPGHEACWPTWPGRNSR